MIARILVATGLLLLSGCASGSSTCPGEACEPDTQARFDAIAALDGVVEVDEVQRADSPDRGPRRSAKVTTDLPEKPAVLRLGVDVIRELQDWEGVEPSDAQVILRWQDEIVIVDQQGELICELVDRVQRDCRPEDSWRLDGTPAG